MFALDWPPRYRAVNRRLLKRLTRRYRLPTLAELGCVAAMVTSLGVVGPMALASPLKTVLLPVAILIMPGLLVAMAAVAIYVTVLDAQTTPFDLLAATPLPGYIIARVYYEWTLRQIGLLLAAMALMTTLGGLLLAMFSVSVDGGRISGDMVVLLPLTLGGAVLGMCLMSVGVGVTVGLWLRSWLAIVPTTVLIGAMIVIELGLTLLNLPQFDGSDLAASTAVWWIIAALLPWVGTDLTLRVAGRRVRA